MCDQLVLSSQSSWSQIGWHQGGVLCITNLLVSTSLGSTSLWLEVFIWWGSASWKNNLGMYVRPLLSFRVLEVW